MCAEQITISPIDGSVYVKRACADKATIDSALALARAAHHIGVGLGARMSCDELAGGCEDEEASA